MSRIAAIQTSSSDDIDQNLEQVREQINSSRFRDANLVVLPECFAFMQSSRRQLLETAELPGDGKIQQFLQQVSLEFDIWIIAGSVPLKTNDSKKVANALLVYDNQGNQLIRYDKIFLFDVSLENGESYRESDYTLAGSQCHVVETPAGIMGLSICYDLRFPELYRRLASLGAQTLVVPSAFSPTTGAKHWLPLLQARAIENCCYVVAPAQWGTHNGKRKTWGHTVIIDPWGEVLSELESGWGLITADIDLERLHRIRQQLPSLEHRRPELFEN